MEILLIDFAYYFKTFKESKHGLLLIQCDIAQSSVLKSTARLSKNKYGKHVYEQKNYGKLQWFREDQKILREFKRDWVNKTLKMIF